MECTKCLLPLPMALCIAVTSCGGHRYDIDDPVGERLSAVISMADDCGDEAIVVLSGVVVSDPSHLVRSRAVEQLAKLADPRAVTALYNVARSDSEWMLRAEAIRALGQRRASEAASRLVSLWNPTPRPGDRSGQPWNFYVADALTDIGPSALPAVRRALETRVPVVKRLAIMVLEDIGAEKDIARLEQLSRDDDVGDAARRALRAIKLRAQGEPQQGL